MATFWFHRKGTATGNGSGSSRANGINGWKALDALINAGTITRGDVVEYDHAYGATTIATDGAEWPCTAAITTALAQNAMGGSTVTTSSRYTNARGIYLGTGYGSTSTASGITFSFENISGGASLGDIALDMRGATATSQRMIAALRIKGEDITVRGLMAYAPDWAYGFDPTTGATRIAGPSNVESASYENFCLMVFGNGNTVEDCILNGSSAFSHSALWYCPPQSSVANVSEGKYGYIRRNQMSGALCGIQIQPYGGTGYDLEKPTFIDVYENTVSDGVWGRCALLPTGPGNAHHHGNGIGVQGKFLGGIRIFHNDVSGGYQDGIAVGSSAGSMVYKNYVHDIGDTNYTYWRYASGAWSTTTATNTAEGNGIKTGLGNRDGASPTTWLGTDGTSGGELAVTELRNVVARNVIRDCQGSGVTTNAGNGTLVHANEIYDTRGPCLQITQRSTTAGTGNVWVSNNFMRKLTAGSSSYVVNLETRNRGWFYNNILWSAGSLSEVRMGGGTIAAKDKNVLVQNKVSSTSWAVGTDMDATARTHAQSYGLCTVNTTTWTFTAGAAVGASLLNAGNTAPMTSAKTTGCTRNLIGSIFDSTPNVGPV